MEDGQNRTPAPLSPSGPGAQKTKKVKPVLDRVKLPPPPSSLNLVRLHFLFSGTMIWVLRHLLQSVQDIQCTLTFLSFL